VRIPRDRVRASAATSAALPPVEPHLALGEEVVLLSLRSPRHKVRRAVALAARVHGYPAAYRAAVNALEARFLVTRSGPLRRLEATAEAKIAARHHRVLAVIRDPAAPVQADAAEILVLLAFCGALTLSRGDRLPARHRIRSIGDHGEVPGVVELVRVERNAGSMRQLAELLLPAASDFDVGSFDPGMTQGVSSAGFTGSGP